MFTDTHTHPYYNEDAESFVARAVSAGVTRMIMPNVDKESLPVMTQLSDSHPENFRIALGLHPTSVGEEADDDLSYIISKLDCRRDVVAIGEIGMDLYWDKTFRSKQMDIFDRQLGIAVAKGYPVIIHCREALDETLEVLSGHPQANGVFHSFGGSTADVDSILKMADDRFYFGINGIVTFKNSNLRTTIPAIPTDRLLLETDSPYLAPVPKRGKPNESSYLPYIAETVALTLGIESREIAEITSENSRRLFGF